MNQHSTTAQNCGYHITSMANCCWLLSLAALWPSCIITPGEQAAAISLLQKRLTANDNRYQAYLEICQRILLTRQKMIEDPGYGITSLPTRFFNSIEKGFAASEKWYQELQAQRKNSRIYRLELRALSEAIVEFTEDATAENFDYWKKCFITNNAQDCWMLYSLFTCYYLTSRL